MTRLNVPDDGHTHTHGPDSYTYTGANGHGFYVCVCGVCGYTFPAEDLSW